jgi:eukaryotic-like serine/threonine-protein kinase
MFKFITSRPLWVNFVAAAALAIILIFLFLKMLGWITKHGEYLTVPAVLGKNTEEAIKLLEKQGFDVEIQDSIFTDTAARGIVLKQLPDANATVKINRTVFLTVNRVTPPMIDMPKLEGQSLAFALDILQRNHLKLGDTTFRPDFQVGTVLEQQYNGERIPEKAKVQWGSRISLVIGGGLDNQQFIVPSLLGLTYSEAKALLEANGISIGAILTDPGVRDTANAFVYKQNPERFDEEKKPRYIQSGQLMDIWLSAVMKVPKDSLDNQ